MKTVRELLQQGKEKLLNSQIDESSLSAELLLAHALKTERAALFSNPERQVQDSESLLYKKLLSERAKHWPVAYLIGSQEFYGLRFEVNPSVLIPRPETELLVEKCLERLEKIEGNPWVIDIGTGSGCIAVTIAKQNPRVRVIAVDRSSQALQTAKRNAKAHHVLDRVFFVQADLLNSFQEKRQVNLIVSNPPYIDPREKYSLMPEVRDFEPAQALFALPNDPSFFHREITRQASQRLKKDGWLLMELGIDQAQSLVQKMGKSFDCVRTIRDFAGIDRILEARQAS